MIESIFSLIGQAVAFGGGGIAIGFGLFKWFGQKWIESKFNIQIKQMEFKQQETIARLKVEVESMLGGALKLQDREFSSLPATWDALHDAHSHVGALVSPMRTLPDFLFMDDTEFNDLVSNLKWTETQKNYLRDTPIKVDRIKKFNEITFLYELDSVKKSFREFNQTISKNAIFYEDNLRTKLNDVATLLWKSILDYEHGKSGTGSGLLNDAYRTLKEKTDPLKADIETCIRERLKSHRSAAQ